MTAGLPKIVATNVRRLLGLQDGESGVTAIKRLGFNNGTAQRVLAGETSIGLDVIERLAKGLGVEPWQLLVPDLDTSAMPRLQPLDFRWPFRRIDPSAVTGLVGTSASQVENGLIALLAAIGAQPENARTGNRAA